MAAVSASQHNPIIQGSIRWIDPSDPIDPSVVRAELGR
jgi:hypothetical protein